MKSIDFILGIIALIVWLNGMYYMFRIQLYWIRAMIKKRTLIIPFELQRYLETEEEKKGFKKALKNVVLTILICIFISIIMGLNP